MSGEGLLADADDVDLFPFDSVTYAEDGSHAFEGRLSVSLNGDLSIITSAVGGAEDAQNNRSEIIEAVIGVAEISRLDDACDGISLLCDETTACRKRLCRSRLVRRMPGRLPVLDVELEASGATTILGDNTESIGLRQDHVVVVAQQLSTESLRKKKLRFVPRPVQMKTVPIRCSSPDDSAILMEVY